METQDKEIADQWIAAELNRIWMVSERALRSFQRAQIRPQPGHPSMAETEAILTARRTARLGANATAVEDEAALTKAIEDAESKLAPLRRKALLGRLVENLGLRPLEVETLVVAIAPHLDAPLAEIFNVLKGPSTGRRGVDIALVSQLFRLKRHDRVALLDALDPERPLLRWRLLQVMPAEAFEAFNSMSHRALKPTFDLVSTLCGRGDLAPELMRVASLTKHDATLDDLRLDEAMRTEVEQLCKAARSAKAGSIAPWLVIYGAEGAGKRTIAGRMAAYGGQPLLVFDTNAVEKTQFDDMLARVQREALIRNAVLYIGPLSAELIGNGGLELARRLEGYKGQIVLGSDALQPPRLMLNHPVWELFVRSPSEPTRILIWDDMIPKSVRQPDVNLESLARGFNLTPGEIQRSAREARMIAERNGRAVTQLDARGGVERRLRNDLGDLARRITVVTTWNDLVLPQQDMDRVDEFVARKKYQDTVYRQWGFGDRVGYGKGLIALFSGPPGTGKTMLAGIIAQALDLDLYQVDLAQVVSKWVGETEKQLGQVFDRAERAHAVLLFDEADSLFAKRTEVKGANDRYGNMATNYLLQRLEQYTGVAVLTTNKDTALDEALQRRLTLHLRLEVPDVAERERLWQSFLPPKAPVESNLNLTALANEFELSGGYIKNAAVRAAFLAASVGAPIGMDILRLASALELEDMGRVVVNRQNSDAYS